MTKLSAQQAVTHTTFSIERTYPATPDRVFAAFSDPAKKRRWFVEGEGFEVDHFEMDFRVGGAERASFRAKGAPLPDGTIIVNDTVYQDIVPNQRIVSAYTMSVGGQRISASLSTFEFQAAEAGTTLIFTEQAAFFEGGDGPKMREAGWRELLESLSKELAR